MVEKKTSGSSQSGIRSALMPIETFCMDIVSKLNMPFLGKWLLAYFAPEESYGKEKKNASYGNIAKYAALTGVVMAIAGIISIVLSSIFSFSLVGLIGVGMGLTLFIIYPIIMVIATFIGSGINFIMAKILGGKGSYLEQTYLLTLVVAGVVLLSAPFDALSGIPFVGALLSLITLAISFYALYGYYLTIKKVHELSTIKAIAVIAVPLIVAFVIAAIFAFIVGAAILGGLASGAAMGNFPVS